MQQAGGQRLERMFLAGMKGQRIFPQGLGRQRILQKRFDAAYNQTNSPLGDAVEHLQPGKLIFPANPLHIPEGEFPRRIDQRFFFAGKCIDILTQAGGHGLILSLIHIYIVSPNTELRDDICQKILFGVIARKTSYELPVRIIFLNRPGRPLQIHNRIIFVIDRRIFLNQQIEVLAGNSKVGDGCKAAL